MAKQPKPSQPRHGEDQSKAGRDEKGMHDTGPRGRSQRPGGTKDVSASTA
ncbi:hypothetical protein ABZ667_33550 [Streptomyces lavendulae]